MSGIGIDEMRRAVTLFSNCNETFNSEYSAESLLAIYRAYASCGWDITPDQWTPEQLAACVQFGTVPTFEE